MKIKKVDDKPTVIHTRRKTKIHRWSLEQGIRERLADRNTLPIIV